MSALPRSVLIVDDDPDTVNSFVTLLMHCGHKARGAINGYEALEIAREFVPDVVLLDLMLPGVDGRQIARQLRAIPGMDGTLLVAASGFGGEEDRRRSMEAGFNYHLVKPFVIDELEAILDAAPQEVMPKSAVVLQGACRSLAEKRGDLRLVQDV